MSSATHKSVLVETNESHTSRGSTEQPDGNVGKNVIADELHPQGVKFPNPIHGIYSDSALAYESSNFEVEDEGNELFESVALTAPLLQLTIADSSRLDGEEEEIKNNLCTEKLEKLQSIRVKFLRLVGRLKMPSDDSIVARVLYRLEAVAGRQNGQLFSLDTTKKTALQLEEVARDDLDFSLNILVLGKSGVGKSATINSIFGEERARVDALQPATSTVNEIIGLVDGVKIRVFDTPGLKSSALEQSFNRKILHSVKKLTKKTPIDIVLYVDRLDVQGNGDLFLLRTITCSLGSAIWNSVILTLTHAASPPPEGPSGFPLSYDMFVSQRSRALQQSIGHAVGNILMMCPNMLFPVCLAENREQWIPRLAENREQWIPRLMGMCYAIKIILEIDSVTKSQDPFDHRQLFGFRTCSLPLTYTLCSMLQSRVQPKWSNEQGDDNGDSDIDLADSDQEDEDVYDQLPPFKPLQISLVAQLSDDHREAYFEEYRYDVEVFQRKQCREELKRNKEMKLKGKKSSALVSVPLPDMKVPPSFDSDNPSHRYRCSDSTSEILARPVLKTHGWDHDCGYDGVNFERSLAIASQYPTVVSVQLTKDKKEFTINLDSSIAAKLGESGSSMAGLDIQIMGKQLSYAIRGEANFKIFRKNQTAAGILVTFFAGDVVTGLQLKDQICFGKQYSLVSSAGIVRSQQDVAYVANIEMQRREIDCSIRQVQSSFSLSIINWKGDLALGFNSHAQFSAGSNFKVAVQAGKNKLGGQISVRIRSSQYLSVALASIVQAAIFIYKKLCRGASEKHYSDESIEKPLYPNGKRC